MAYDAGKRYIRNRVTGVVFPYREKIVGLADLEIVEADGEGNLQRVSEQRTEPSPKLAPTKTPEKKDAALVAGLAPATTKPTLVPADDK